MEEYPLKLIQYGWNQYWQEQYENFIEKGTDMEVGRVITAHQELYRVATNEGEVLAQLSGRLRYTGGIDGTLPTVGDWVVLQILQGEGKGIIHGIFPRRSKFSRKVAGTEVMEQVVAANFDTVWLLLALNQDFNLRRLERYLITAWESGAIPVVVLSKADLCTDVDVKVHQVEEVAVGVDVQVVSSYLDTGFEGLQPYIQAGKTVAILGSSGVGKSTLVNKLAEQELLRVQQIRDGDDKGRHTTTHRELITLPTGGMVIDTPGMRELGLWEGSTGIEHVFEDIAILAEACRFRDCHHQQEPGCEIQAALQDGRLSADRYASYLKLQKELAYVERQQNRQLQQVEKQRYKQIAKHIKQIGKKR